MALSDNYYTKAQAAAALNTSERTLNRWWNERIGPPRTRIGVKVYYRIDAVNEWLRSKEVTPVREQGRVAA